MICYIKIEFFVNIELCTSLQKLCFFLEEIPNYIAGMCLILWTLEKDKIIYGSKHCIPIENFKIFWNGRCNQATYNYSDLSFSTHCAQFLGHFVTASYFVSSWTYLQSMWHIKRSKLYQYRSLPVFINSWQITRFLVQSFL